MAQELTSDDVPRQAGEGSDGGLGGCVNSVRPQELQNMRLVVDVGDGKTIEIPLKGHLALHNCGSPSQAAVSGETPITAAAPGQETERCLAVAESQDPGAKKHLNNMRGWIMTIATLFVGMSFQAMSHRPSWMPDPKDGLKLFLTRKHTTDPVQKLAVRVVAYVLLNTIAFSMSLGVVVVLLLPDKFLPKNTWKTVMPMMMLLAITISVNFSFMISEDARIMYSVITVIAFYVFAVVVVVLRNRPFDYLRSPLRSAPGV